MKSSGGLYYQKLDHVRAFAAYLVFMWHLLHFGGTYPIPFSAAPLGLALLDEGHVGVGLFMVLSGYLFTKIIGNQSLDFRAFLWNRVVRLVPLLALTILAWWWIWQATPYRVTLHDLLFGFVLPTWPGGAWSITTEFHFYLLLPVLLYAARKFGNQALIVAIIAAITLRAVLFVRYGSASDLAYWTIIGRFDQFTLGMLAARLQTTTIQRRYACLLLFGGFALYMEIFNRLGGFDGLAKSPLWIIHTTIEGTGFAALILWYDHSRFSLPTIISKPLAAIGCWSYSIYLLHLFVWLAAKALIHGGAVTPLLAILVASIAFAGTALISAASYVLIEKPFLRFRIPYLRPGEGVAAQAIPAA